MSAQCTLHIQYVSKNFHERAVQWGPILELLQPERGINHSPLHCLYYSDIHVHVQTANHITYAVSMYLHCTLYASKRLVEAPSYSYFAQRTYRHQDGFIRIGFACIQTVSAYTATPLLSSSYMYMYMNIDGP